MTSRASCEQKLRTFSTQNVLEYKEEALFIKKPEKWGKLILSFPEVKREKEHEAGWVRGGRFKRGWETGIEYD